MTSICTTVSAAPPTTTVSWCDWIPSSITYRWRPCLACTSELITTTMQIRKQPMSLRLLWKSLLRARSGRQRHKQTLSLKLWALRKNSIKLIVVVLDECNKNTSAIMNWDTISMIHQPLHQITLIVSACFIGVTPLFICCNSSYVFTHVFQNCIPELLCVTEHLR